MDEVEIILKDLDTMAQELGLEFAHDIALQLLGSNEFEAVAKHRILDWKLAHPLPANTPAAGRGITSS
jgi:hypothetical protein